MVEKVKKFIEKYKMIQSGDTIILGISGGADSVCLLFVLLEMQKSYEFNLVGVHVNHNLRPGAAERDQAYVERLCAKQGVPCTVFSIDVTAESKKRKRSHEETGREVRQESFAKVAEQLMEEQGIRRECIKIATAHHSNDNAETMLMNLARGTGLSGMTGIAPVKENRIRPILDISRGKIEQYLEEINIPYCIDATNNENIYTRNVLRNEIIPMLESRVNGQAVQHMNQTMEEMRDIEAYLDKQVHISYSACVQSEKGRAVIGESEYRKIDKVIRHRLLKRCLEEIAEAQRDLGRTHVEQLEQLFEKQVGREIHLPYEVVAKRVYQGIRLEKQGEIQNIVGSQELTIPAEIALPEGGKLYVEILNNDELCQIEDKPYTKYFDYDIIDGLLSLRTRDIGDRIVINASGNKQTLKKYYTTNKIPEEQRDQILLLTAGHEILWVIGYRKSSGYEITENTKNVLKVRLDGGRYGRNN